MSAPYDHSEENALARVGRFLRWTADIQLHDDPASMGRRVVERADARYFFSAGDRPDSLRDCWVFLDDLYTWGPLRNLAATRGLIQEKIGACHGREGVAVRLTSAGWNLIGGYPRHEALALLGGGLHGGWQ